MFDYLFGLIGVGGAGLGIAAWFVGIPALLGIVNSLLSIASPFLKGISELAVWYVSELWDGAKTILSNASTFVVLATVAVTAGLYGANIEKCTVETLIKEVSKQPPKIEDTTWDPFGFGR